MIDRSLDSTPLLPTSWSVIHIHAAPSADSIQPSVVGALTLERWGPIHFWRVYLRDTRTALTDYGEANYVAVDYVTADPHVAVNEYLKATGERVSQRELNLALDGEGDS